MLEDFLQHVVRELASVHILRTEFDSADLITAGFASDRADLEGVPRDGDNIKIVQVNGVAGVGHDCTDVTGEKILVFANAENERRATTGSDQEIFDVGVNERDAVGADHLFQGRAGCVHQPCFGILAVQLLINAANQMREHLGISVRGEFVSTFAHELLAQRGVILDHPVVDQRDLAALIKMRVSVFIRNFTVGSPAGVAYPVLPRWRSLRH